MTTDKNKRLFQVTAEDFKKIPGSPIAYWLSPVTKEIFQNATLLENLADVRHGLSTGKNEAVVRLWHEIAFMDLGLNFTARQDALASKKKWFPYNKGGEFRKWYGNAEYVLRYDQYGNDLMASFSGHRHDGKECYFKEGVTWTFISSTSFAARYTPCGYVFDVSGSSLFVENPFFFVAFLCTNLCYNLLKALNPTINFQVGNLKSLPVLSSQIAENDLQITGIAKRIISFARQDWDSYETSWDFQRNPLIQVGENSPCNGRIMRAYLTLLEHQRTQCEEMRKLETENNRIFIEAYGLQEELSPDVPWNEITLTCNPWYRYSAKPEDYPELKYWERDESGIGKGGLGYDGMEITLPLNSNPQPNDFPFALELEKRMLTDTIKELLSYAVGCMFGRYSLDVDGLAYAGGEWDDSKYRTFPADADNIIPICDDDYFEDDLTGRFVKFIETVYGAETLEENLNFIAHALGGRGSAREVIRSYFRNDFFEDHCKVYQKRPIYWLFDSGKKGGFRALIYMHRYQPDTIAKLRVDYVHEQQERYRTAIADLTPRADAASGSEKVKLAKRLTALRDQAEEVRLYEEKIHHLADRMVSIDLDDGVKHNYAIFQDVLARIK